MSKLIIASAATALIMGSSTVALAAASAADCQALFERADINRDGALQSNEASLFLEAMTQAQVRPQDASNVTPNEFMVACQKDAFVNIDPGMGAAQAGGSSNAAASTSVQADQSVAAPAGFMASNLIGVTVSAPNGENIGDVRDLVLSQQGEATHFIVDIGDKNVEVERSKLNVSATENGLKIVLNGTRAELAELPAVNVDAEDQQTAATSGQTSTATQELQAQQPAAEQATSDQQVAEPSLPAPSGVMASNLIGATVYSQNDENIGGIRDIVLSDKGEATHVLMDVSGKTVELERSKLTITAMESGLKVVVNSSQAELAQLPAVDVAPGGQQAVGTPPATPQEPSLTGETTTAQQSSPDQQPAVADQPETSQTLAAPEGFMASNLIGATVKTANDENLGEIKDVVFSDRGEATHVIIDIGDKNVEVERSKLDISASEDGLKVALNSTQADLAQLPGVNIEAADQQGAATTTQPAQEPATEQAEQPAATGQQAATTDATGQQSTTAEQSSVATPSATEGQAPSAEQPSASGQTTSTEQTTAPEQPASSEPQQPETSTAAVEQPATGETSQAEPAEQALAIPEGLMVSDLIGATIHSPNNEKLGEINDLALPSGAGQPPRVIIGVGGFFGIGEKDVSVDMSRLKFTTTDDGLRIVLDATKQDLENLAASSQ